MDKSTDIDTLLDRVIAFRSNTCFRELLKKACANELLNLMNVGMDIEHEELKIPDKNMLPPLPQVPDADTQRLDVVLEDVEHSINAIDFL